MTPEQKQTYHQQGYLIVRKLLTADRLRRLSDLIEDLLVQASQGKKNVRMKWRDKDRMLPKARVLGFLHDAKGLYDPYYEEWLNTDIQPWVEFLLGAPTECDELSGLFGGTGKPWVGNWHCDKGDQGSCVVHAPVTYEDHFHQLIPDTHARELTEREREAERDAHLPVPTAVQISLSPGDVLFRYANVLHRGANLEGKHRITFLGEFRIIQ